MDNRTFKNREDIPLKDRWATEDLYASDELWEQELAAVAEEGGKMAAYAGRLAESGETLFAYLQMMEQVWERASLLGNYCSRKMHCYKYSVPSQK